MEEIIERIPFKVCTVAEDAVLFPGIPKEEPSSFSITVDIIEQSIISTGLYLPPGIMATIEIEDPPPNVTIQIGAHSKHIIGSSGPWKRWPNIVSTFHLKNKTEVISSYGGIVYLAVADLSNDCSISNCF